MEEIGGYLELEHFSGSLFHDSALALNCGRGCLRYLVEARHIKRIWLPFFLCDSVYDTLKQCHVEMKRYRVSASLQPIFDFDILDSDYVYLVDYYGQLTDESVDLAARQCDGRIIVDETQNFFAQPHEETDTLYTTRKYFGVPDGGFLYTQARIDRPLDYDSSLSRLTYLVGRLEQDASSFYAQACANNDSFANQPARIMSKFTENILRAVDFDRVIERRNSNYGYLEKALGAANALTLKRPNGPFAYPLMIENGPHLRETLARKNIYIPTLWPNVAASAEAYHEVAYAQNILPLPVDQRYTENHMKRIVEALQEAGACL